MAVDGGRDGWRQMKRAGLRLLVGLFAGVTSRARTIARSQLKVA
jgi:hypothetical protein